MEQRRLLLFIVISMAFLIGWSKFVVPVLVPEPPQQAAQPPAEAADEAADVDPAAQAAKSEPAESAPDDARPPADGAADADGQTDETAAAGEPPAEPAPATELVEHERRIVKLGSLDPESGYLVDVEVTTQGAAVAAMRLNDPRYRELNNRDVPLKVLGAADYGTRTLATSIPAIEAQLERHGRSLATVDWKIDRIVIDPAMPEVNSAVVLSYQSPDERLTVSKRFSVQRVADPDHVTQEVRDNRPDGYQIHFELTIANTGSQKTATRYVLQGPVGMPLENADNARKFRDLKVGFLYSEEAPLDPAERSVEATSLTVNDVVEAEQEGSQQEWKRPLRYIGVDVQYFAALLVPAGDQLKRSFVELARPMIVGEVTVPEKYTDISVELTSEEIALEPGGELTHAYDLFAGPKRQELLDPLNAGSSLDFGMFGFFSKLMLSVLKFFHDLGIPYGIAIICLTIVVRGCMFPLSRKQAASAKKMKELQPKIVELKKKHENDKEKFARAQLELFRQHNYSPFSGCLPIFVQFPIFIGLYQALNNSVDLRMASFMWIDNLAAPDALFKLPFMLPFLGSEFNLLPIVTVLLFIAQQKMFMPPPTDEQQAMQYKMMNYMMIFMGFFFYHVPAGLCVYFIASSLWGMGERKMLDYGKQPSDGSPAASPAEPASSKSTKQPAKQANGKPSLWQRLLESADAAAKQTGSNGRPDTSTPDTGSSGRTKKKRRSRSK